MHLSLPKRREIEQHLQSVNEALRAMVEKRKIDGKCAFADAFREAELWVLRAELRDLLAESAIIKKRKARKNGSDSHGTRSPKKKKKKGNWIVGGSRRSGGAGLYNLGSTLKHWN